MKQEILDFLNKQIVEEHGRRVTMDSKFVDAELDSLGTMIVLATMDAEYNFGSEIADEDFISELDIPNLTIRRLVKLCVLSTTNSSKEQNEKTESS